MKCVDISTFDTDQRERGLCAEGTARAQHKLDRDGRQSVGVICFTL